MKPTIKKLWIAMAILVVLTPLGLALPELFHAGDAWGEWSVETVRDMAGFTPSGMEKNADLWHSPVPDYSFTSEDAPFIYRALSYVASAVIGAGLVYLMIVLAGHFILRRE